MLNMLMAAILPALRPLRFDRVLVLVLLLLLLVGREGATADVRWRTDAIQDARRVLLPGTGRAMLPHSQTM